MELEPWAMKTLLLLQSSTEDAPYKLREMLVETIQQKYGGRRPFRPVPPVPTSWLAEFRAKKLNQDRNESMKRNMQQDSPAPPTPESNLTYSTDSTSECNDDVTIELVEDGLSCAVCSEIGFNPYDLVECAECHSHYHKECHSPPISDRDVSDPRVVWYCRRCARANKVNTPSGSGQMNNVKHNNKLPNTKGSHTLLPSSSLVGKHFGGNLGTSTKRNVPGKFSSSNNLTNLKVHTPNLNIISADKRLQIMKKKAAKKQDKRVISK